ncbi:MAG TPA: PDZ domain-containing protein [Anaerolineae bacterium]|nr:PDZ domain-containing protein [Anaerolineae bacterium]
MPSGYYRYPTIHSDTVVFACEDDLWTIPATGGVARRLTSNLGEVSRPLLSPDGTQLAFVGREEGQSEIYLMPAVGGQARRLTFMGGTLCLTAGWTRDGAKNLVVFANNAAQPFPALLHLYVVDAEGNPPERIEVGPARTLSYGPDRGMVIGRNTGDPARWKRYRGGTVGQLWIDETGDGMFKPLIQLPGNLASPMWIGNRIYFVSDHEGIGNLYSCLPSGDDLRRHTDHDTFYARNPSTDGRRIVYHAGADLHLFDPATGASAMIPVEFYSPQTQRNRKFVNPAKYLQDWTLHPKGHSVAVTSRGKAFVFANWEGAVVQLGEPPEDGVRYRLPHWLNSAKNAGKANGDGERLVAVTDEGGEEAFVVVRADGSAEPERLAGLDIGRPEAIAVNPKKDQIVFSNHRYELVFLDLATREMRVIDRGRSNPISGFDWSPDGAWVAYSVSVSLQVTALKLWEADTGEVFTLTQPVLRDVAPAFDPQGKYLYFLSYRHFDPVYDNMHFDLNFPRGMRLYLITLQKDLPSPFIPVPRAPGEKKDEGQKTKDESGKTRDGSTGEEKPEAKKDAEDKPIQIDLDGIESRIVAFPLPEGIYGRVAGTKNGKVLYSRYPVEGSLQQPWPPPTEPPAKGTLLTYNFEEQKEETIVGGITDFEIGRDGTTLIVRAGNRLRVLKAGEKPDREAGDEPGRKSGWLDLSRVKVSVVPGAEWGQMFREAWRLQRDQFWTPDMSKVDWVAVHDRYLPLVDRVSSRSEFSDLMWEMQGELGTSHCYELGGDYRPEPDYAQGYLGADFEYDAETDSWRIARIVQGDAWDEDADSPLNKPGLNVKAGDRLIAINGRKLSRTVTPAMCLVNLAGSEVTLTIGGQTSEVSTHTRTITVEALRSELPVRYREWVEANRRRVHQATGGRVGYVHIPDMGARGYAEFHRGYLAEVDREGVIVDVRFNSGGHVSSLILEKLARRRLGYDKTRWGQEPVPYPLESVIGPMVALTNEQAGSDGDIFSHGFKMLKLGPLLGKRTWGGVIGIEPRHALVDGALTTQPEFSFWFSDVGWGVENYGADPDVEIDNTPQDYARGVDAQLERAVAEIQEMLAASPPQRPTLDERPSRALPKLPPSRK